MGAPLSRVRLIENGDRSLLLGVENGQVARGAAELLARAARYADADEAPDAAEDPRVRAVVEAITRAPEAGAPDEEAPVVRGLNISNTYHCNMGCSYCYNELPIKDRKGSEVRGGMRPEVARRMVDALFEQSGDARRLSLVFIGGEPLLERRSLEETVAYARALGRRARKTVDVSVYTNGTLLDDRFLTWANRRKVFLVLSLDGPPEVNDRHRVFRSGRPSSPVVLRNIERYMARYWCPVRKVTAVTTERTRLLPLARYLVDLGFNDVQIQASYGLDGFGERGQSLDTLEILAWYRALLRADTVIGLAPFSTFLQKLTVRGRATASWYPCTAGVSMLGVGPDGSLYPCHHGVEEGAMRLGNVADGIPGVDARRPWFQRVDQRAPCSTCWARHACGGECYHRAATAGVGRFGVMDAACRERKGLIGLVLDLFAELALERPAVLGRLLRHDLTRVAPRPSTEALARYHADAPPAARRVSLPVVG